MLQDIEAGVFMEEAPGRKPVAERALPQKPDNYSQSYSEAPVVEPELDMMLDEIIAGQ